MHQSNAEFPHDENWAQRRFGVSIATSWAIGLPMPPSIPRRRAAGKSGDAKEE